MKLRPMAENTVHNAPKEALAKHSWYVNKADYSRAVPRAVKAPINRKGQLFTYFTRVLAIGWFIALILNLRDTDARGITICFIGFVVSYIITYIIADKKTYKKKK